MFTWICPKCGREVPPAYNDCPDCAPQGAGAPAQEPQASVAAPPAPQLQSAPVPVVMASNAYQPPLAPGALGAYQAPPPVRGGLPTWLLTILFAFAFFGLVAGVYWLLGAARGTSAKPTAAVESPAAKPNAKTSPYQKYI